MTFEYQGCVGPYCIETWKNWVQAEYSGTWTLVDDKPHANYVLFYF
jgi:hypothetical protein